MSLQLDMIKHSHSGGILLFIKEDIPAKESYKPLKDFEGILWN